MTRMLRRWLALAAALTLLCAGALADRAPSVKGPGLSLSSVSSLPKAKETGLSARQQALYNCILSTPAPRYAIPLDRTYTAKEIAAVVAYVRNKTGLVFPAGSYGFFVDQRSSKNGTLCCLWRSPDASTLARIDRLRTLDGMGKSDFLTAAALYNYVLTARGLANPAWFLCCAFTRYGIPTILLTGKADGKERTWLLGRLDGVWYHFDPAAETEAASSLRAGRPAQLRYFALTDTEITYQNTHTLGEPTAYLPKGSKITAIPEATVRPSAPRRAATLPKRTFWLVPANASSNSFVESALNSIRGSATPQFVFLSAENYKSAASGFAKLRINGFSCTGKTAAVQMLEFTKK